MSFSHDAFITCCSQIAWHSRYEETLQIFVIMGADLDIKTFRMETANQINMRKKMSTSSISSVNE
jgi:hypothetical protein